MYFVPFLGFPEKENLLSEKRASEKEKIFTMSVMMAFTVALIAYAPYYIMIKPIHRELLLWELLIDIILFALLYLLYRKTLDIGLDREKLKPIMVMCSIIFFLSFIPLFIKTREMRSWLGLVVPMVGFAITPFYFIRSYNELRKNPA